MLGRRVVPILSVLLVVACSSSGSPPARQAAARGTRSPTTGSPTSTTTTVLPSTTTTVRVAARPAEDPVALAAQVTAAESAIRAPDTPLAELPALGHAEQVAYRQLVAHPEWQADVYARLPADLVAVARAHVAAGSALRSLVTEPKDTPPSDWQIVDPAPADQLRSFYDDAERQTGIPWYDLAAVNLVESRMGRIHGTSSAGAKGPMQFIDSTWTRYGVDADGDGVADVEDPHDAIVAAARYLRAAGGPADMRGALFAYNHATAYVDAVTTYAEQMRAEPRRLHAYYGWQVYYLTTQGDVLLPVGYGQAGGG